MSDIETALSETSAELFEYVPGGGSNTGQVQPEPAVRNSCYSFRYETGDEAAFEQCDHIFEDEFRFSRMHHLHRNSDRRRCVQRSINWSSCQNPLALVELGRYCFPENR